MSWSIKAFLFIAAWIGLVALVSMFRKDKNHRQTYRSRRRGEGGGFAGDPGDGSPEIQAATNNTSLQYSLLENSAYNFVYGLLPLHINLLCGVYYEKKAFEILACVLLLHF